MWSPFIMQKLISDNRLFEFIQKKKRLFEFEMWEDLKSQSKEHVQSQRTCSCELRQNFHEAAKSILDMDWLSKMPVLTLVKFSLSEARFSEDVDCSTMFDHKSSYAVITRQRIGKNSQIPLIFKIISVLPLGMETGIRTRRRQSLKQFILFYFYFYFFMKIKINIYFIFNKILYIK